MPRTPGYPGRVVPVILGMPTVRRSGPPAAPADRPEDPRLLDRFGRVATDLRVSLTDRCNLRCSYCMPPEGLPWLAGDEVLTDAEVVRLVTVAVEHLGVTRVRLTGGEPLLRRGLEAIVRGVKTSRTARGMAPDVALTTNGIGLEHRARSLAEAGLDRVNVSLDSLDRARFARITLRDRLPDVLAGLRAAVAAGLAPVKINAVLLRGVNDDEAVPLLRWALRNGYRLRFIEQMPLEPHGTWRRSDLVTAREILDLLSTEFGLVPVHSSVRGAAPAETWLVERPDGVGGRAEVGIVAAVTRPFCGDCDRTRLTADGQIRTCLFARTETDLRSLLRAGASDAELAETWRVAMWGKQAGHGIGEASFLRPERPMSAIGG
ncbi:MAG: GTP 3',8-cyclase MoaA [Actinomycetales bacterium]|nr:GTP 3',8-cyclase MoaA [Actinomycetales bacterium]